MPTFFRELQLLRFITRLGYDVQIKLSKARAHTQGRPSRTGAAQAKLVDREQQSEPVT
jgi:hypothetical protein